MIVRYTTTFALAFISILLWFNEGTAVANSNQAKSPIQYRLSFRMATSNRVEVEMTVPVDGNQEIELMMPVWTPGSYLVREYARQIESISARDIANNKSIPIQKTKKNRWKVTTSGIDEIAVTYVVYCHEMSVRTNWVEPDFAFLTGAATFLTRADALEREHIVRIDAIPSWPKVATSLKPLEGNDWVRSAANFDDLVDSPILLGDMDIQSFEIDGVKHYLATLGGDDLWDTTKAAQDVKKIVEKHLQFWENIPYPEYWFINLATESRGGLEHDNSTLLMTSRWAMKKRASYVDWLGLVSHEFFHTWNVRRLRPEALVKYDFENEQYTNELWVAEGVTSYYDDLLVVQSGLYSEQEYIDLLNKVILGVQTTPGNTVQSLRDSSYDTWIKFYRPDENAHNSRVSYYTKGSLAAMLLDTEIRDATDDKHSLRDVMLRLWAEKLESGYTTDDVIRFSSEVAGKDLREWFHRTLEEPTNLDYQRYMERYGFEWKQKDAPIQGDVESTDSNAEKSAQSPERPAYLGAEVVGQQGKAILEKIVATGPAAQAGLSAGDELIAVNGYRIASENWADRLSIYSENETAEFLIARRGKLHTVNVKFATPDTNTWTLKRVETPTEQQQANWKKLIGLP